MYTQRELKLVGFFLALGLWVCTVQAQPNRKLPNTADSSLKEFETKEISISATRYEVNASDIPLPMSIIKGKQIQQMGAMRLNEVLAEQTGLNLVYDHGTGLQMQGINPEYILILIDGEPLIGRSAGTLDLTRIALSDIERVEVVKGPSSSLFGSEALGGVVNIITKKPKEGSYGLNIRSRYGTNQTTTNAIGLNYGNKKFSAVANIDRYQTAGFANEVQLGPVIAPNTNYTFSTRLNYEFKNRHTLSYSGRYFNEFSLSKYQMEIAGNISDMQDASSLHDISNIINYRVPVGKHIIQTRFNHTLYNLWGRTEDRSTEQLLVNSDFKQSFMRPEVLAELNFSEQIKGIAGFGYIGEQVNTPRFMEAERFNTIYGFAQAEYRPSEKWMLMAGFRYDRQSVYGDQLSPKATVSYKVREGTRLFTSLGRGFKAPDFRQLYMNFINPVGGYSVLGAQEAIPILRKMQSEGLLETSFIDLTKSAIPLAAENSWSINLGIEQSFLKRNTLKFNLFRNNINDLIETQVVARTNNGQSIFSYQNFGRVYTQGFELELSTKPFDFIQVSGGYQFLQTANVDVLTDLDAGKYFSRDPLTLETRKLTRSDYGGLFGRSRNMANLRIFAEDKSKQWAGTLRFVYRGRYGFTDMNGNGILDAANEYVPGYLLINASVQRGFFNNQFTLQTGVDNIGNFRNRAQIPQLFGRMYFVSLSYNFKKLNSSI